MDLRGYEREKFRLAELLRSLAVLSGDPLRDDRERYRDLFVRLAEDRFNLVVVGRVSRGNSSLMNAILSMDRLPTGIPRPRAGGLWPADGAGLEGAWPGGPARSLPRFHRNLLLPENATMSAK